MQQGTFVWTVAAGVVGGVITLLIGAWIQKLPPFECRSLRLSTTYQSKMSDRGSERRKVEGWLASAGSSAGLG